MFLSGGNSEVSTVLKRLNTFSWSTLRCLPDSRDQEVAVSGFKRACGVFQSAAVKPVLIDSEVCPGENVKIDQDILKVIMSSSDTIHHAAGANRMGMGKKFDGGSVMLASPSPNFGRHPQK